MDIRMPVHASSRGYLSATANWPYDGRQNSMSGARQPLQESTGNAQPTHLAGLTTPAYAERLAALASITGTMPAPPILPSQSFGGSYGGPSSLRLRQRHQLQLQRLHRHGINPIKLSPGFQNYRKRQTERDDKSDQKWPDELEDPFLDALLLIPQMGRRKYTIRGKQHGRNMLITEYLWIAYCQNLPPGVEPDQRLWRQRKQVSSHIQVLKKFFEHHPRYHFFFPSEEKKKDRLRESVETESFKNHPVLVALSEGRFPEERPNYEYFAQLLAFDALVTVRPKRCWIFVSNPKLELRDDSTACHTDTAEILTKDTYPHLATNFSKERWPDDMHERGVLLHEYTQTLDQKESSSSRDLRLDWEESFPELFDSLDLALQDGGCDILHMHTTLELQKHFVLPRNSDLNGWVEVDVSRPSLLNDQWKVVTRLTRPRELCRGSSKESTLYEATQEIEPRFTHRPGCDARNPACECMNQRQRHVITVPFPAEPWARMLTSCSAYPAHPFDKPSSSKRASNKDRRREDRGEKEEAGRNLTQMDLIPQVAMIQELWSRPSGAAHDGASWTRRSVLLWTFETVHSIQIVNQKNKLITVESGRTHWRFLTALDPTSQYHQEQALLKVESSLPTDGAAGPSRDSIMSPAPSYQQRLQATMSENFPSGWDSAPDLGGSHSHAPCLHLHVNHHTTLPDGPAPLDILDALGSGLATPPPTASLTSSFARAFDAGSRHHHHHGDLHAAAHSLGYLATTSAIDPETTLASTADPYLPVTTGSCGFASTVFDDTCSGLPGWEASGLPHSTSDSGHAWLGGSTLQHQHQQQHWPGGGAMKVVQDEGVWGAETASPPSASTIDEHEQQQQRQERSWVTHSSGTSAATATWQDAVAGSLPLPLPLPMPGHAISEPPQGHVHDLLFQEQHLGVGGLGEVGAPPKRSRKRNRTDSAEDRENYPLSAVPKLQHHSSASAGVVAGGTLVSEWD